MVFHKGIVYEIVYEFIYEFLPREFREPTKFQMDVVCL